MRSRSDKVGDFDRVVMNSTRNQPGVVSHVNKQLGTYFVCNLFEFGVVNLTRVGTRTGNDQFWFVLSGQRCDLVEIDSVIVFANSLIVEIVQLA